MDVVWKLDSCGSENGRMDGYGLEKDGWMIDVVWRVDGCGLGMDGWMWFGEGRVGWIDVVWRVDGCGLGNGWMDVVWGMDGSVWF